MESLKNFFLKFFCCLERVIAEEFRIPLKDIQKEIHLVFTQKVKQEKL